MTINDINEAITETKRFIKAAEARKKRAKDDNEDERWMMGQTKEGGALRRASMDLTRALAKLRGRG